MNVAGTSLQRENGINDSPENNVKDLANPSSKYITDNPVFSMIMHRNGAKMIEELRGRGLEFVGYSTLRPRIHIAAPAMYQGGNTLIELWKRDFAKSGGKAILDTKVTGDGITFAESAGGYLWAADAGYQFVCVDTKRLYDLPTLSTFASSIMVNLSGDRFVNESLPFTIPARALRSQKGGNLTTPQGQCINP